uniref:Uncharacterized protein n=1 Tax=Candidatus Kentrum sp. FW TaxID=2126338 RepID=A0A450SPP1_9GAMM|nr:MAG: hypothetical protein BECKFW1821A_GA0114235_105711 [Candidatus Kentron sp. FW]VFJ65551.1 MAG: hypothetical protein BECKFW1821B_GA0114236_11057 [Candidatus Kentron sp. FW]
MLIRNHFGAFKHINQLLIIIPEPLMIITIYLKYKPILQYQLICWLFPLGFANESGFSEASPKTDEA